VPSVRELARELAVNPNTVARAYQQLQNDGILQPVRGMGLQISTDAEHPCRQQRDELLRIRFRQAFSEAQHSGLSAEELRQLVESELHTVLQRGG
jgi:GntR family transcriptional regulator